VLEACDAALIDATNAGKKKTKSADSHISKAIEELVGYEENYHRR
jgi:hypothetical protein